MKVLIVGGGGREHALVWAAKRSPIVSKLYCAPGNGGIAQDAECVDIAADDIEGLFAFAERNEIDLTIVGPEQPLVLGIADRFESVGLPIWAPSRAASALEGSKRFSKEFMQRVGIPSAKFAVFSQVAPAIAFLDEFDAPYVIKADGLAAGKGVVIAPDRMAAETAIRDMLEARVFGEAGAQVVIEEFIRGEELSFIALCDGRHALPFASSQDHKRLLDGDQGPNTGGMGAYSPAPLMDKALEERVMAEVVLPLLHAMAEAGTPYRGFLYAGIMVDLTGAPKVLEFNCRLGDPEAQALLFRLESDLVSVILEALSGELRGATLEWAPGAAACVVLAAEEYPAAVKKGQPISGIPPESDSLKVFHAGTRREGDGFVSSGGRVLGVTAKGVDLRNALARAYRAISEISWNGMQYRRDIGEKGLRRQ